MGSTIQNTYNNNAAYDDDDGEDNDENANDDDNNDDENKRKKNTWAKQTNPIPCTRMACVSTGISKTTS